MNLTPEKREATKNAILVSTIQMCVFCLFLWICIYSDLNRELMNLTLKSQPWLVSKIGSLIGGRLAETLWVIIQVGILVIYIPFSIIMAVLWFSKFRKSESKITFTVLSFSILLLVTAVSAIVGFSLLKGELSIASSLLAIEHFFVFMFSTITSIICIIVTHLKKTKR